MNTPYTFCFRTHDYPEANGRKPLDGENAYDLSFTLEDGRQLIIQIGQKGYDTLSKFLQDMAAGVPSYCIPDVVNRPTTEQHEEKSCCPFCGKYLTFGAATWCCSKMREAAHGDICHSPPITNPTGLTKEELKILKLVAIYGGIPLSGGVAPAIRHALELLENSDRKMAISFKLQNTNLTFENVRLKSALAAKEKELDQLIDARLKALNEIEEHFHDACDGAPDANERAKEANFIVGIIKRAKGEIP